MGGSDNKGDGLASQPRRYQVPGQPLLNRHQVGSVSRSPDGLFAQQEREPIRGRPAVRGKRTYGGRPGQRVEERASRTQNHSKAGYGRPVDRGAWTAKTVKRPRQQPAHPQYANYWAPLTRKRHTMPHSAQPQHTNYWAPRTRKRHQQEHRPQWPTESSNPTQHAKGRTGDCPGPRKGATTRRNVTQGDHLPPLHRSLQRLHRARVEVCLQPLHHKSFAVIARPYGLNARNTVRCTSSRLQTAEPRPLAAHLHFYKRRPRYTPRCGAALPPPPPPRLPNAPSPPSRAPTDCRHTPIPELCSHRRTCSTSFLSPGTTYKPDPQDPDPFLRLILDRVLTGTPHFLHIASALFGIVECDLHLSDGFVYRMHKLGTCIAHSLRPTESARDRAVEAPGSIVQAAAAAGTTTGPQNPRVLFEQLRLLPVKLNVTLSRIGDAPSDPLRELLGGASVFVMGMSNVQFRWNCLLFENTQGRLQDFQAQLRSRYLQQTLTQVLSGPLRPGHLTPDTPFLALGTLTAPR